MRVTLEILDGPNYQTDESGWEHHAYTVRLTLDGRTMETPWMQGLGITDDPDAASVLESLMLDASGIDNTRDFTDWAVDYGYDVDSRKAEALYERCKVAAADTKQLLGDAYDRYATTDAHDAARELTR